MKILRRKSDRKFSFKTMMIGLLCAVVGMMVIRCGANALAETNVTILKPTAAIELIHHEYHKDQCLDTCGDIWQQEMWQCNSAGFRYQWQLDKCHRYVDSRRDRCMNYCF